MTERSEAISAVIPRERDRLYGFIRRRVPNRRDAEDILQEVFFEFVRACSLPEPIGQVGSWLIRVARNRIIDRVRKKREEPLLDAAASGEGMQDGYYLDEVLPSIDSEPEAAYARAVVLEAISNALNELPADERDVFIAHELDGESFKEISARSGINVNTLLGWKRRAVLQLRSRLQPVYDEFI